MTAGIEYGRGLAGCNDREVTAVSEAVTNGLDDLGLRNTAGRLALKRVIKELPSCQVKHIKSLVEAAAKSSNMLEINSLMKNNEENKETIFNFKIIE